MLNSCQHGTVQAEIFSCRPLAQAGLCVYEYVCVGGSRREIEFKQIQECDMSKKALFYSYLREKKIQHPHYSEILSLSYFIFIFTEILTWNLALGLIWDF